MPPSTFEEQKKMEEAVRRQNQSNPSPEQPPKKKGCFPLALAMLIIVLVIIIIIWFFHPDTSPPEIRWGFYFSEEMNYNEFMPSNININIDIASIQRFMGQLSERLNRLSPGDIALVIVALMMPPIAVLLKVGLTTHFWINVLLTILGFIPGQIHGLWVVLFL